MTKIILMIKLFVMLMVLLSVALIILKGLVKEEDYVYRYDYITEKLVKITDRRFM